MVSWKRTLPTFAWTARQWSKFTSPNTVLEPLPNSERSYPRRLILKLQTLIQCLQVPRLVNFVCLLKALVTISLCFSNQVTNNLEGKRRNGASCTHSLLLSYSTNLLDCFTESVRLGISCLSLHWILFRWPCKASLLQCRRVHFDSILLVVSLKSNSTF